MTPGWTPKDEREYIALRERYLASTERRRQSFQRMRDQRQEVVNERRGLDWMELEEMVEDDSIDPDVPQAGQGNNVTVSC